jgi:hypothetical protein
MPELIPHWKAWYKRWSTWLLASAGMLSSMMAFMPSVQEYIDPHAYKMIMLGLSVATFIALQVKQASVSGAKPDDTSSRDPQ